MNERKASNPNTQLPVGPLPEDTGVWHVSLTEIEAMCRKAARGAGYSWGLAEEAGRAARLLACHNLPGPEAMNSLLHDVDGSPDRFAPQPQQDARQDTWNSAAGKLCPIHLGAALSDLAAALVEGTRIATGPVLYPILVLPFLMAAGRDLGITLAMESPEFSASASASGPACEDWATLLNLGQSANLVIFCKAANGTKPRPRQAAARRIDVETWRDLDDFARRTYAPASEESRLSGAGAGMTDRD